MIVFFRIVKISVYTLEKKKQQKQQKKNANKLVRFIEVKVKQEITK